MTDEMRGVSERLVVKASSARWFLTVLCGWTFAYLACTGRLEPKDAVPILVMVITYYFSRSNGEGPK